MMRGCQHVESKDIVMAELLAGVTRFEVIDHQHNMGRVYSVNPTKVSLSFQDQGRTLKVFLEKPDEQSHT